MCCRDSPICDAAPTRWCWNLRAPARCSRFAIRRLRPPWLCCRHRNKSGGCADIPAFRGSSCSPCSSTAKSCSRPALPAAMASDRPRATIASCFGIFTIFCSTRAAPRADTPTRWAGLIPMSASFLRYRRCGPTGRETKLICASSPTRILRQSHWPQSCCVNVTRRASSTTSGRSRSASLRGFSTALRACSRNCKQRSMLEMD